MNNERQQGESIAQWKRRLQANNRYGIYAGELEPAIIRANSATIDAGRRIVGSKQNDYRVNQSSLFGQRRYNSNPSIAQKLINGITDKLHLTSPPTFTDGYNRELNAEVPLSESAQGQELKRMGSTALKGISIAGLSSLPFSFYYAPLATTAGLATGASAAKATDVGMNLIENATDTKFTPEQRTIATFLTSLPAGIKGYKWGWNTEKRAIEAVMSKSMGNPNPLPTLQNEWRNMSKATKKDLAKYIFTGKGKSLNQIFQEGLYTGSGRNGWWANDGEGNMVRAYLYDEPLPRLHEVTGEGKYGPHDEYVLKNYPDKYGKIKVYEGTGIGTKWADGRISPQTQTNEPISVFKTEGDTGDLRFYTPKGEFTVDASGHLKQTGLGESGWYTRHQDIFKFNRPDYNKRWTKSSPKQNLINWGLDVVDKHGTPVITRTTWGQDPIVQPSIDNINKTIKAPNFEDWAKTTTLDDYMSPQYDNVPEAWFDEIFKTATDKEEASFKNVINDYYNNKLNGKGKQTIYDLMKGSDSDIDVSSNKIPSENSYFSKYNIEIVPGLGELKVPDINSLVDLNNLIINK